MTDNKNLKKVPKKSAEELFANVDYNIKNNVSNKEKEARKKKAFVIFSTAIVLASAIVLVGYYISNQSTVTVERETNIRAPQRNMDIPGENDNKIENLSVEANLDEWARTPHFAQTEENKQAMLNSVEDTSFNSMIVNFPSEKDGFTSDYTKKMDESGLPNIYYTHLTAEDLKFNILNYINRLINPIYGGYINYQTMGKNYTIDSLINKDSAIFEDMYTKGFLDKVKSSKNTFLLVDKDNNNFGYKWRKNDLNDNKVRFAGKIKDIYDFKPNEDFTEFTLKVKVMIFGYPKSGKITQEKELELTFKLNNDVKGPKLLISNINEKDK